MRNRYLEKSSCWQIYLVKESFLINYYENVCGFSSYEYVTLIIAKLLHSNFSPKICISYQYLVFMGFILVKYLTGCCCNFYGYFLIAILLSGTSPFHYWSCYLFRLLIYELMIEYHLGYSRKSCYEIKIFFE